MLVKMMYFRRFGLRRTIAPLQFMTRSNSKSQPTRANIRVTKLDIANSHGLRTPTKQSDTRPHDHAKVGDHLRKTELPTCTSCNKREWELAKSGLFVSGHQEDDEAQVTVTTEISHRTRQN